MQTLTKAERLRSRKTISLLFEKGKSITMHPLKMLWLQTPNKEGSILQFTLAVPKKNFKRAVDRNRLKRQMREAMRKSYIPCRCLALVTCSRCCWLAFLPS